VLNFRKKNSGPEECSRDGEARKKGWRILASPAEGSDQTIAALLKLIRFEGLGIRINKPVVRNSIAGVELHFDPAIPRGGGWRKDLDNKIRRAFNPPLGDHAAPLIQYDEQVGLDDGHIAQDQVNGGDENFPRLAVLEVLVEEDKKIAENPLVPGGRSRDHLDLPLKELVAAAIIRKGRVVGIGEDNSRCHG
jgi:hypothetical protein